MYTGNDNDFFFRHICYMKGGQQQTWDCGLIVEIDGQSKKQKRHREYGAILLVKTGGCDGQRGKIAD